MCIRDRIGTVILVINIPIILWAIVEIGYKLVAKTMVAIVLNSVMIDVVALFMPAYHGDALIITLIGGVCEGVGLSLVFMRGATTGGTDMIARLLNHRLRHLSMGKLMLAVDGCIVLASAFVFQSIESAVYACIVIFVSTKIIDTILYGTDVGNGKMFFIFSKKNEEIAERILTDLDRGVTFLKSRGAYLKQEGELLLCAVRRFEVFRISEICLLYTSRPCGRRPARRRRLFPCFARPDVYKRQDQVARAVGQHPLRVHFAGGAAHAGLYSRRGREALGLRLQGGAHDGRGPAGAGRAGEH